MTSSPNPSPLTAAKIRSAFGPGYQFGGASDYALRLISASPAVR